MTEKLFYQDSHLAEFEAKVLSCEPVTPDILPGHSNGYAAELDRTAFFPEGGGQYADTGVLGGVRVTDVQEKRRADPSSAGKSSGAWNLRERLY